MPPNISHRLLESNKYGMYHLMMSIELAMSALSDIASTVVDVSVRDHERTKSRWVAEVEIGPVSKIFAVPKNEAGKTLEAQEAELSGHCAEFVATKMKELLKVNTPALTPACLLGFARNNNSKYSSSFWNAICEHLENPNLESKPISDKKGAKQGATAEQTLVPKAL